MRKEYFIIYLLLFFTATKIYATKTDSLLSVLKTAKKDTNRVNALNMLSEVTGWRVGNYDTAVLLAKQAQTLAQQLNYKKGIASAYGNIGVTNYYQGNYPEALKNYSADLKVREEIDDKKGIASAYNNIGILYYNQGNYPEAIKNYLVALKIREEIQDKKGAADSYNNLGNVYIEQGNYQVALKYYSRALKLQEETGDKKGIADSYNNFGNVYLNQGNYPAALKNYFAALKIREKIAEKKGIVNSYNNIGVLYEKQGNYTEALKNHFASLKLAKEMGFERNVSMSYINLGIVYSDQSNYSEALKNYFAALKIAKEIGLNQMIPNVYNNIGIAYHDQRNYSEALKYSFAAFKIQEEVGDKHGMAISCNNIGEVYIKQKQPTKAKQWYQKCLALSQEIGSNEQISVIYENLAQVDSSLGNYQEAYSNYKQHIIYRDSLFNEENTKKLVQTAMQYDFDKKEALTKAEQEKKDAIAASELKRRNLQRNASIGGLALMFLLASVFFTQRNRINKEKKRSDALLLNILPSEVAEELKEHGESEAKYFDEVSVLFTDFVDFTLISESLLPKELVKELHTCFKAFDDIITRHGLEKIKTIGDAYMAVCGLPLHNAQHAQNTVKAAQEILQFINKRKQENPNGFRIRIGINSGSVVAGIVGVKKFSYDIWGDAVNTAARMESNGEAGRINISGSTYELVKEDFTCEHRGKIQAKGKGEVDMYFVN